MLSPTNTEHLTDTLTVSPTYTSSPTELPQPNDDVTITPTLTLSPIETLDPSLSEKPGQDFLRDCVSSTLWMPFEAKPSEKSGCWSLGGLGIFPRDGNLSIVQEIDQSGVALPFGIYTNVPSNVDIEFDIVINQSIS